MPQTLTRPEADLERKTTRPRPWNVVLLDDDDHTFDYVIDMLGRLFGHPPERATLIAKKVDAEGRAVCLTTHKEHAEFKAEQVLGFGADRQAAGCAGSMSAVIEPADFGGD